MKPLHTNPARPIAPHSGMIAGLYQMRLKAPGPRLMPPTGTSCQFLTAPPNQCDPL